MVEFIENIDRKLFLILNSDHGSFWDEFFYLCSQTVFSIPIFLILIYLLIKNFSVKEILLIVLVSVLCVALTDIISVHLFKNVFLRYRPTHNFEIKHLVHTYQFSNGEHYLGGMYGFVSSHAANFAGLTSLYILLFRKKYKLIYLLFIWLILISFSRIYLGVHYPIDILGGWIVGFVIGSAGYLLIKKKIINRVIISKR